MRQYIFRGKRKDNGQWVYGSLIDKDYILDYIDLAESWTPLISDHKLTCRAYKIKPETVGMWTGLEDKQRVQIFEGDLIRFAEKYLYVVKFEDAKFVGYHANNDWGKWGDLYKLGTLGFDKYNYGVIGNIHDNPELLNAAPAIEGTHHMLDPNIKTEEQGQEEATQTETQPETLPGTEG